MKQKKRERTQINKIKNERGEVPTNITEIQTIIREYYEQVYTKLYNIEEMDKFLETYNLPRLNQDEKDNLNRHNSSTEIKSVIKKTPSKQKSMTGQLHWEILPNI